MRCYRRTRVLASDDPFRFELSGQVGTIDSHAAEVVVDEPDRDRVQEVELLPPLPRGDDETRLLQHLQVLHDTEARHAEAGLECAQRLPVLAEERVEETPARGIGEGFEHRVHALDHR